MNSPVQSPPKLRNEHCHHQHTVIHPLCFFLSLTISHPKDSGGFSDFYYQILILPVFKLYVTGIIQHVSFKVDFFSTHLWDSVCIVHVGIVYSYLWEYFTVYSFCCWWMFGLLLVSAILNNASVNMLICVL